MPIENEIISLKQEMSAIRELLGNIIENQKENQQADKLGGVAVKTSTILNGIQASVAKAIRAQKALGTQDSEDIENFVVKDVEVEFAAALVTERNSEEPILMIPNVNNVSPNSPLIRLKFSVSSVPPKE